MNAQHLSACSKSPVSSTGSNVVIERDEVTASDDVTSEAGQDNRVIQHSPMYLVEEKLMASVNCLNDSVSVHAEYKWTCKDLDPSCHHEEEENDHDDDDDEVEDIKGLDNTSLQDMDCFTQWAINSANDADVDDFDHNDGDTDNDHSIYDIDDERFEMHEECDSDFDKRSDGCYSTSSSCIFLEPTEEERERLAISFPPISAITTKPFNPQMSIEVAPQSEVIKENGSSKSVVAEVKMSMSSPVVCQQKESNSVSRKGSPEYCSKKASHEVEKSVRSVTANNRIVGFSGPTFWVKISCSNQCLHRWRV